MIPTKICNKCGAEKEISQFYASKRSLLGVTGTCKVCRCVQMKEYVAANPELKRIGTRNRNRSNKELAVKSFGDKCLDCQQTYPQYVYQFHHLDPTVKGAHPSVALTRSPERMWAELSKCVMLCANCHMIRHHGMNE